MARNMLSAMEKFISLFEFVREFNLEKVRHVNYSEGIRLEEGSSFSQRRITAPLGQAGCPQTIQFCTAGQSQLMLSIQINRGSVSSLDSCTGLQGGAVRTTLSPWQYLCRHLLSYLILSWKLRAMQGYEREVQG